MRGASMFGDDFSMGGASSFSSFGNMSGRMPAGMDDTGSTWYTQTQSQPPPKKRMHQRLHDH